MSDSVYQSYRTLVRDTTIHDVTLLSTDYLNHFNEVVMLLEIVPDMPEMFDDVKEWQPKTYQEHFRDSQFTSRDLAVDAYDFSPPEYREPFDQVIDQLNTMITNAINTIDGVIPVRDAERLALAVADTSNALRSRIDQAGAIINGSTDRVDQDGVDAIFGDEATDMVLTDLRHPETSSPASPYRGVLQSAPVDMEFPLDVALAFSREVAEVLGRTVAH